MNELIYSLASAVVMSLISLAGAVAIFFRKESINKLIPVFVAFAAGALLGAAFFDVLPEAVEHKGKEVLVYVLLGLMMFFVMERYIHWHHCHSNECRRHYHPMTYLNLVGDALHNFVDGALIAASFMINVQLGIVASFAIAAHEIPQEIGDFAILVHGGLSRFKALAFNFVSSLTAIVGVLSTFFFAESIDSLIPIILAVTGGGFIYIATADLIPKIHRETNRKNASAQFVALSFGIAVIFALTNVFHEH